MRIWHITTQGFVLSRNNDWSVPTVMCVAHHAAATLRRSQNVLSRWKIVWIPTVLKGSALRTATRLNRLTR
jgi:hypothetical protein